jgi:hypothetical protein
MSNLIVFPLRPGTPFYNRHIVAYLRRKRALPLALAAGGAA